MPDAQRRTAVLVFHGMGQQREFETLNDLVRGLLDWNARELPDMPAADPRRKAEVELFRLSDEERGRASVTVGEGRHRVDVYEAYWSPLTKGKVADWEVVSFLFFAGLTGLWMARNGFTFTRVLFGKQERFRVSLVSMLALLVALAALFAAVLFFCAAFVVGLGFLVELAGWRVFDRAFGAETGIWLLATTMVVGALLVAGLSVGHALRFRPAEIRVWFLTVVFYAGGLLLAYSTAMMLDNSIRYLREQPRSWLWDFSLNLMPAWSLPPSFSGKVLATLTAIALAFVLWWTRDKFVTYVGDVTAYLSAYKVNEFFLLREQVRRRCYALARYVYNVEEGPGRLKYDRIVFVGHSLGSVIAFDTLAEVLVAGTAKERTKALITLGSPLNKQAFLFRADSAGPSLRNELLCALNPLIGSTEVRSHLCWVNLHTPLDPVSGSLDYFDPPEGTPAPPGYRRVLDYKDLASTMPLVAHTEYWAHDHFRYWLYWLVQPDTDLESVIAGCPNRPRSVAPA